MNLKELEEKKVGQSYVMRQSTVLLIIKFAILALIAIFALFFMLMLFALIRDLIQSAFYAYLLNLIILIIYLLLIISTALFIFFDWKNEVYVISGGEVSKKRGVFNIQEEVYKFEKLERVTVSQGILGKIFNYGNLDLYLSVRPEEIVTLMNVSNPNHYLLLIEKLKEFEIPNKVLEQAE